MTVIGKREGSPVTRIKSADPEGSSKVLRSALAALRLSLSAGEMIATLRPAPARNVWNAPE